MSITKGVCILLFLMLDTFNLVAQEHTHSFSIGLNYSIHRLKNGLDNNDINGRTSLILNNNFSFQSKSLTDNSKFFLTPFYKLDLSYNRYWNLKKSMIFSVGFSGSGRNFDLSEYALTSYDGKPIETPSNRLYRRYYNLSIPIIIKYKASNNLKFNTGFQFNYALLEPFESVFYNTNPENIFYFTAQLGAETRLYKNWYLYGNYNQGFVNVFNDDIVLYSQLVHNGYPYRTNCFTKGSTFQFGVTNYFNTKEKAGKIDEATFLDSSKVDVCFVNENNQTSVIDLYLNKTMVHSNIKIDSIAYCIQLNLEQNKRYKLEIVAKTKDEVITTISVVQNNYIKNKLIWKPGKQKKQSILLKLKS